VSYGGALDEHRAQTLAQSSGQGAAFVVLEFGTYPQQLGLQAVSEPNFWLIGGGIIKPLTHTAICRIITVIGDE
jgi:hypothetical protein